MVELYPQGSRQFDSLWDNLGRLSAEIHLVVLCLILQKILKKRSAGVASLSNYLWGNSVTAIKRKRSLEIPIPCKKYWRKLVSAKCPLWRFKSIVVSFCRGLTRATLWYWGSWLCLNRTRINQISDEWRSEYLERQQGARTTEGCVKIASRRGHHYVGAWPGPPTSSV